MSKLALSARHVAIRYRTYLDPSRGIRELAKTRGGQRRYRDIEAVKSASFDLYEGERVGIVGHNGAGKSTMLLGLAGLIELNGGEIVAKSRPALLGVGAVLNPALSGRRNIEMGCLALGTSRQDLSERVDQLIDFTGLREFADVPLRAYSSGMKARLAFTVATTATPEILLIDEALAVGDKDFRSRAEERLEQIRDQAGCVVLVSHNLSEVRRMCERVIWMDHGRVVADGTVDEVVPRYEESTTALGSPDFA
jgi:teichoic acid transport system ATP-binding protein